MKEQALLTLKSSLFIKPVLSFFALLISTIIVFSCVKDEVIYPNLTNYTVTFYTDSPNGGNSEIVKQEVSDSAISLIYQLNSGFNSPYVGLSITPKLNGFINAKKYNQINLSIKGEEVNRIGFALYTPPLSNFENLKNDETLNHCYLNISNKKQTYAIAIHELKHPEWWDDIHQIQATGKSDLLLNKILHINIGSAFSPEIAGQKKLEIYSIVFTRNNQLLFILLTSTYIALVLLFFTILLTIRRQKNKKENITVSYQSLEITQSSTGDERCIDYINRNYDNSNLSLDIISKAVFISPRRITTQINEQFNCNFKTYLNRIRINESKRFLTQTDLNIGEIAFKVGFNNQSHFNRVFKSEMNLSPTEYREKQQF